jgi:phosphatidate phosphatase PAH1
MTFINVVSQLSVLSAGFGNKPTDVEAYREIGLPPRRIFIVNKVKIAVLYLAEWVLDKEK